VTYFAGIDYDSAGIYPVFIDEDTGAFHHGWELRLDIGPSSDDAFDRTRRVRDAMPGRGWWADAGVLAIGIESTYSHAFRATAALARLQGAIVACLPPDIVVVPMAAHHGADKHGWKALTVGSTNASKLNVRQWAVGHGAPTNRRQDIYDAFCIARAMRTLWDTRRIAA
jgi:hypothetical protein